MSVLSKLKDAEEKAKRDLEKAKTSEGIKVKTVVNVIGLIFFLLGVVGLLILYAC